MVIYSLNPDLVEIRCTFINKSSIKQVQCITIYKVVSEAKEPKSRWRGIELYINEEF